MNSDDFQRAEAVLRRSRVITVFRTSGDWLHRAASRSLVAAMWRSVTGECLRISLVERIRLAGVLLLTATMMNQLLLSAAPRIVRPAAAQLLGLEAAALALAMIVFAAPIGRAWPGSRLRRLLRRGA